ncbi:MAG: Ig-like domain-containing protein [Chitinophagaceae bacterium]
MKKIYTLIFLLYSFAASSQVVINDVYGGGGNSGATYKNDFIELYNNGLSAVSLAGWSVQYASSTGTTWAVTNLTGSIPAKGYYLIQQAAGTGGTTNLPTPDATGTIAMSGTTGKVVLSNVITAQTGANPTGSQIIDKVGYGAGTNGFEGTGPTATLTNTTSAQRTPIGFDSNNNSTDFTTGTPSPTNAGGGVDTTPPTILALSPANGATNVATSFTATITFSETVKKGTSGTITIKKFSDNTISQTINITTTNVIVSGSTASFDVSSLAFNTAYYVEISNGAFTDLSNNNFSGISGNATWKFTTSATAPAGSLATTYSFNTCSTVLPDGFSQYSVLGDQKWGCTTFGRDPSNMPLGSAPNGVQINGFLVTNIPNEDWLITPSFNLTGTAFPLLSFWSRTAFNGAPLQLKISPNYPGTGDPRNFTWTDLNGRFPNQTSDVWTLSNNINLSAFKQASVFIAFVYTSTIDDGARWTLDDIRIDNSITAPPPTLTVNTTDIQYTFVASGATADKTFTFIGNDLTDNVTLTSTGVFLLSKDGIAFSPSITYTVAEANNISKTVSVRFAPTQPNQNFTGSITVTTSSLSSTVNLKGTSIDPVNTLEVVNWNVEWFGSPSFGPTNDDLQEQNVKTILQNIGSDIYGLTEVVDTARLGRVVRQMPGYSYIVGNFGSRVNPPDPTGGPISEAQKLAFVYKTATFKNIVTRPLINNQNVSSTSYNNWSSGRYPFLFTADVTLNCVTKRVNFVLIHGKANTSPTATSYARRQAAANELRDTLNTYFPNDNIIILGDFNDDLDKSITAGFTTTSYTSFTTDTVNFFSPTLALSLANKKSTVSYNDVIDHVIVSNEMQPLYMPATANILTDVASLVSNYGKTTTDHYPVFTRYQFKNTNPPVVTIRDGFAINAGGQPNTVYVGYSPASSITLTPNVTGGTPAYSYMWSTGTLTSGVTVSPVVNTTYTLTVTDANGCTATANKSIVVVNVAGIKNAGNVMICHNTNGQMSTLEVEQNTVAAHLAHGDLLGTCTAANILTLLRITASPNPISDYSIITVEGGNVSEKISLIVTNSLGEIIERRDNIVTKSFRLAKNYRPGLYFIHVVQGNQKAVLTLVKPK